MTKTLIYRVVAAVLTLTAVAATPAAAQECIAREQAEQLVSTLKQRNEQLRDLTQRMQEMEARSTAAGAALTELENGRKLIAIAVAKNRELAEIGEAIVADYEKMNLGRRTAAREPLTQLYRVRLENKMEEFRDQLAAQGFYPERELETLQAPASPSVDATRAGASPATPGT